jgi:23S rRNA pseudouridine1911/1915/1917 synthase
LSGSSAPFPDKPLIAVVGEEAKGQRLDKWLATIWPFSRSSLAKAAKDGLLTVDEKPLSPSARAIPGQTVVLSPSSSKIVLAKPPKVPIIYQDEDFYVVNKPSGLAVHPAPGFRDLTLAEILVAMDPSLAKVGDPERPGLVHRLDKDTSGVMAIARTQKAFESLSAAFAERRVQKKYLAFVKGRPIHEGLVESGVGRHPSIRRKMAVKEDGRPAKTFIKVLRTFKGPKISLVELTLLTGRTHQARVHLAAAKSPVLMDEVYGPKRSGGWAAALSSLSEKPSRQLLHARRLAFPHPNGGKTVAFRAPWPQDFIDLWRELIGWPLTP